MGLVGCCEHPLSLTGAGDRAVGAGGQTRSFAYDLNDNPVGETNPRQFAHSQTFDALDRLVGQSDPLGGKTSSQDYQYAPDSNRLTAIGAQAVTSDAAGNLTQDRPARKLAYDAQGRLQSVSQPRRAFYCINIMDSRKRTAAVDTNFLQISARTYNS